MGITMTEFVCWGTSTASESEDRSESRKLSSTPGTAWHINCIPFYANSSWNYQAAACISVCARISTILQLWTATIFIVVVFILYLSIQRRRRTKSTCWVFGLASVGVLGVEQQSSYQQTTNIHNSEFLPQSSSLRFVSSPVLPTLRVGPAKDSTRMEWTGEGLLAIFFTKNMDHILFSFCNTAKNRGRAVVIQYHTVNRLHCRWFVTGKVVRYLHT